MFLIKIMIYSNGKKWLKFVCFHCFPDKTDKKLFWWVFQIKWLKLHQQFPLKRKFKWSSVLRCQCPIYNGALKNFVWSSIYKDINVFVSLACLFAFAVSAKVQHAHFLFKRCNGETHRNKHFLSWKKTKDICNIIDQFIVSRAPLKIGHFKVKYKFE